MFSNGTIKIANQKFTSIKNDHCIIFDQGSEIEEVKEDKKIATQGFCFTKIKLIEDLQPGNTLDILGIVLKVGPLS
jgi:replication factor A1